MNVSHRPGYYERVPVAGQTVLQRQFEAAQLVMTGAGENDLKFSALCLPVRAPGEKQTLGVVLQIPKEALAWNAGQPIALEAYGYGVGEDGTVRDHFAQLARVDPAVGRSAGHHAGPVVLRHAVRAAGEVHAAADGAGPRPGRGRDPVPGRDRAGLRRPRAGSCFRPC